MPAGLSKYSMYFSTGVSHQPSVSFRCFLTDAGAASHHGAMCLRTYPSLVKIPGISMTIENSYANVADNRTTKRLARTRHGEMCPGDNSK